MGLARYGHNYILDKDAKVPDAENFVLKSLDLKEKSFWTNFRSTGNVYTMDFGLEQTAAPVEEENAEKTLGCPPDKRG